VELLQTASERVSEFAKYNNTLAFDIGNELALYSVEKARPAMTGIFSYPCMKALSKDLKMFMKKQGLRSVPTLYAMQDPAGGEVSLKPQMKYLACSQKKDPMDRIDIIGINSYSWCQKSNSYEHVYAKYVTGLPEDLDIPLMLTEFGCTGDKNALQDPNAYASKYPWTKSYRSWEQVPSIYNVSEMGARYSGGFAYDLIMYAEMKKWQMKGERISESYGLIATRAGDNVDPDDPDFKKLPTYYKLAEKYKEVEESVKYAKHQWDGSEDTAAMACGEKMPEENMTKWLWNYYLVDRDTGKRSSWWNDKAANYLATGDLPGVPTTTNGSHTITYVVFSFLFLLATFCVIQKKHNLGTNEYALIDIESDSEFKRMKDDDAVSEVATYGSFSETDFDSDH